MNVPAPSLAGDWDVQLSGDGKIVCTFDPSILLIGAQQIQLEFTIPEVEQLAPQLQEALLAAKGLEKTRVKVSELDEGDLIPALDLAVDYIQVWERGEVGVWMKGKCVLTFRDPEHVVTVIRKIQ